MSFTEKIEMDDIRRSVKYHPTVWGDYFLEYDFVEISAAEKEEHQRQKEEVSNLLNVTPNDHSIINKLELIDAIQRLGVAYHFENDIEQCLKRVYENYNVNEIEDSLHVAALHFRLLRQQGYDVSPVGAFRNFIDNQGKFKESVNNKNVQGILSLYEASHFRVHGETILDNASEFSSSYLIESMSSHQMIMGKSLERKVNAALTLPIHKTLPRLGAKTFISIYQSDGSRNEILLKFAKLDFNLVQKIHQNELSDITRWRKVLDYVNEYSFTRDRVVECYYWATAASFEPEFHFERKLFAKVTVVASLIDDIYDVYGTVEDLQLFTNAIQRWDINAIEQLPTYMRNCYRTLLDVYAEMEDYETAETGKPHRIQFAKQEMIKLTVAYLEEAKWLYDKYIPTMEEYMKVGVVTAGHMMFITVSLVCMGKLITDEEFKFFVSGKQLITQATDVIARLMDDMAGHGFETKISAVDCYMNQHGTSKEVTFIEFRKEISKAWKDINQECLQPTLVARPILDRMLNLSRMIHFLYTENKDAYTNPTNKTKESIECLFVEPIPS